MHDPISPTGSVRTAGVVDRPLSVDRLLGAVSDRSVGGVALFVGIVRDHDHGSSVDYLDYSVHPEAERAIGRCAADVAAAHDVIAVAVEHRSGHLVVGDLAVVIAVGAVHRQDALAACADLIDRVKAEVPIWKEQHLTSGVSSWVGLS